MESRRELVRGLTLCTVGLLVGSVALLAFPTQESLLPTAWPPLWAGGSLMIAVTIYAGVLTWSVHARMSVSRALLKAGRNMIVGFSGASIGYVAWFVAATPRPGSVIFVGMAILVAGLQCMYIWDLWKKADEILRRDHVEV